MKLITLTIAVLIQLLLGAHPAAAQDCTQTYIPPEGDWGRHFVLESSIGLFTHMNRLPFHAAEVDIYEKSPVSGAFELTQTLSPEVRRPGENYFGDRTATDGNIIAVLSESVPIPGESSTLYIFEKNPTTLIWEQAARIAPPANSLSHQFGGGVAVSEGRVVVGSQFESSGKVYVIERDPITGVWDYSGFVLPPPGVAASWFGFSVDLEGDRLAVGDIYGAAGTTGSVHIFEYSHAWDSWVYVQTLTASGLSFQTQYGLDVEMEGDRILIGARGHTQSAQSGRGGAYLWQRNPISNIWSLVAAFDNPFAGQSGTGGEFVGLDGDNAYFSVEYVQVTPGGSRGGIQHFMYDAGLQDWVRQPHIEPTPIPGVSFWAFVAYNGFGADNGTLIYTGERLSNTYYFFIGSSDEDCDGNGVADRCEINSGAGADLNGNGLLDVCEGIGTAYCRPTALNSVGEKGLLLVDGSLFAQENSVTLRATKLSPNQFGYAVNSPYQGVVINPGGSQGNLCIFGSSLGRHNRPGEVRYSGAAGEFDLIVDLTNFPSPMGSIMVQAGETWNFQVWYKDQNPSNTSNLTNAVSLTFQ
ncbi:MAG: hypothetical protein GY930_04290 [bacterium]|nr:hypothetical protein [bacterium]